MSVIFDALKKLNKKDEDLVQQESADNPVQSNVIVFNDLLKKHALVTYGFIAVIACGIGVWLYFLYQFKITPSQIRPMAPVAQPATENNIEPQAETTQIQPQAEHLEEQQPAGEIVVSHIRPEQIESVPFPVTTNGEDIDILFETAEDSRDRAVRTTVAPQQTQSTTPIKGSPPAIITTSQNEQQSPEVLFEPEGNSEKTSITPTESRQQREHPSQITPETILEEIYTESTEPEQTAEQTDQTDFSSAILVLNEELHQSITAQDYISSQEILAELEGLLDPNSNYILNLKAYLHLQNNEIDKAHTILSTILENDNTELEAGLNMIVVLTQQGKLKNARRQVAFLLDYYPANQSLLHFKQQLGQ